MPNMIVKYEYVIFDY